MFIVHLTQSLVVLLALIGAAFWLKRRGIVDAGNAQGFTRIVTELLLPALVFASLSPERTEARADATGFGDAGLGAHRTIRGLAVGPGAQAASRATRRAGARGGFRQLRIAGLCTDRAGLPGQRQGHA